MVNGGEVGEPSSEYGQPKGFKVACCVSMRRVEDGMGEVETEELLA